LFEVTLNEFMISAIAHQTEAERERRAKIINGESVYQAAQILLEAMPSRLQESPRLR
jgi:regulator of protease activity HflC (stomatin/prohibitin superfamily)